MREEIRKHDKEPLNAVLRQILALSDVDKAYLMGHLVISPWNSMTYDRYTADGEGDIRTMIEWLDDRLRYLLTDGKEGSKSILDGEEVVGSTFERKDTMAPLDPLEDELLKAYSAALLVGDGRAGTTGEPPEPHISIELRDKNPLRIIRGIFSDEVKEVSPSREDDEEGLGKDLILKVGALIDFLNDIADEHDRHRHLFNSIFALVNKVEGCRFEKMGALERAKLAWWKESIKEFEDENPSIEEMNGLRGIVCREPAGVG